MGLSSFVGGPDVARFLEDMWPASVVRKSIRLRQTFTASTSVCCNSCTESSMKDAGCPALLSWSIDDTEYNMKDAGCPALLSWLNDDIDDIRVTEGKQMCSIEGCESHDPLQSRPPAGSPRNNIVSKHCDSECILGEGNGGSPRRWGSECKRPGTLQ